MRAKNIFFSLLILAAGCSKSGSDNDANAQGKWPDQTPVTPVTGNATFNMSADADHLNVMENTMPRIPLFPVTKQKELKLNGYVADLNGKPLQGAYIGLRSPGTVYIAASAETDANGYYEMQIPLGGADIYAAGYTIDYGNGRAALSLCPADASVSINNPGAGATKHFVLLSYGLADPNKRASEPWSSAGYFGGSIRFDYSIYDPMWTPHGIPADADVKIKLTPQANSTMYGETKSFTITKRIGQGNGNFVLNNIPIGTYDIEMKLSDGRNLKMTASGPYVSTYPNHGLFPREATGTAKVLFTPMSVEARSPNANSGYWRPVNITIGLP